EDEPQSPADEVARQLALRHPAEGEIGAGAGQQKESRRADVCNPAREEQPHGSGGEVGGIGRKVTEEIVRMVERHDHHDQPARDIDGFDARSPGPADVACRRSSTHKGDEILLQRRFRLPILRPERRERKPPGAAPPSIIRPWKPSTHWMPASAPPTGRCARSSRRRRPPAPSHGRPPPPQPGRWWRSSPRTSGAGPPP